MRQPGHRRPVRAARALSGRIAALLGVLALAVAGCTPTGEDRPTDAEPTTAEESAEPDDDGTHEPEPEPEPEPLAWGPTQDDLDDAIARAGQMDDGELAGQVIVARYSGTDPAATARLVADHNLAGVILFSENIAAADQVRETAAAVQEAHEATGRDWPAVISVDNEGGAVQRMSGASGPWTTFPPFAAAGAAAAGGDERAVREAYQAMAIELRASGVTMNFAPVADVSIGAADPTINTRAAGSHPEVVEAAVEAALDGFADGGVLTSIKHFPGHGSLTVDSHVELPVLDVPESELRQRDLAPFDAGVQAGAPMVMMGHIAVTAWDEGVPASLSPRAYQVLREYLGFTGVAITDGLDMGALTTTRSTGQIAVEALAAGADLLLTPANAAEAQTAVAVALDEGTLDRDRVVQSAGRVIALQRWQAQLADDAGEVSSEDVGSAGPAVAALSAAAVTIVAGPCEGPLVGQRIAVMGGTTEVWNDFGAAAADAGLEVVGQGQGADVTVRLITPGGSAAGGDVAISFGGPWLIAGADAPTRLVAHGDGPQAMAAVAAVLAGQQPAPGRLGFAVDGVPSSACD